MKKDFTELRKIAEEIFDIQEEINGNDSGGIDPRRRLRDITVARASEHEVLITVTWQYEPTGGLSDCIYHVAHPEKLYTSEFLFDEYCSFLMQKGIPAGKTMFTRYSNSDHLDKAIKDFYNRHSLAVA